MRTPWLDRRIVGGGVAVVIATMVVVDLLVFAGVRASLTGDLDRLLDERVAHATAEAAGRSPEDLARRLAELGMRATVTAPDGSRYGADPQAPAVNLGISSPTAESGSAFAAREVALSDGTRLVVYARRANVDRALYNVALYELAGIVLAGGMATLLFSRLARLILKPLRKVAASARLTSSGQVGERLRPDQPESSLGQLASAYDQMLDALELAVEEARAAQRTSERLYDEARQLAAIVESAQDAMFSESLDGRILTWNAGASFLYGYTAEEVVGRPTSMLVPAGGRDAMEDLRLYVRNGRSIQHREITGLTRAGVPVDLALTMSPIRDDEGTVVALSTIARDLTEQRWLAETLDSTLVRLEKALLEARAAEDRSRQFLSHAAHQLRSPIAGVQACAETLLRHPKPPAADGLLASLVRESSRASRLIASLLRLARMDEGQPLRTAPADLVEVCRNELDRGRLFAPNLELELHATDVPPALVDVDAVREILANLLDNARRHARRRIDVIVGLTGDCVALRVAHDGRPVAPDLRDRIFERFVTLDGSGGSGLGLPIGRDLARAQGGDLICDDDGFVLTLPVYDATPDALPLAARSAVQQ